MVLSRLPDGDEAPILRRSSAKDGMTANDNAAGLAAHYLEHRAELLRFLVARTRDRAEAEDVLQEIWFRLGRVSDGPIANGRAYLYRMAQNLVLNRRREAQRRSARDDAWQSSGYGAADASREPADVRASAEDELIEREQVARLASAIANLPEGAQRAFRLHKIDGLSHADTAAQLGISRSGVEKHIALAMKHLRLALRD